MKEENQKNNYQILFLLKKLWNFFSKKRKIQFFIILVLMFISGFAEMVSFTAVIPFLSVLTEPERFFGMQKFEFLYRFFNIQSGSELLIPISVVFISLAIFAAIIKLTTIWISGKYAAALGSEISIKSFSKSLMQPYSLHIQKIKFQIL